MSSLTSAAVLSDHARIAAADRRRRTFMKYLLVAAFAVPGMLLFFTFVLLPIAQSGVFSFYRWNGLGPLTAENFRNFGNFEQLFAHKTFHAAISHTLLIIALSLSIQLPLALGLALMVGRGTLAGRRFFRLVLFVPYVFSDIITAILWRYVLDPSDGLINVIIRSVAPNYRPIVWLGQENVVMVAIFFVLTWKYFGFYMILFMAALQNVPGDLEDAARIDGAGEGQVLRFVTLPLLGPTLRLAVYLSVLGAIQQFVIVWILTTGGPVDWSETLGTYVYKFGIKSLNLGYGSAVSVVLFVVMLVFSLTYQRFVLHRDYVSAREGSI